MFRALIMAGLLLSPAAGAASLPGPYPAEVLRVLDGDSFEARVRIWLDQDVTVVVRIAGIDTAELDAPCASARIQGAAARAFVAARLQDADVTLKDVGRDKFGGRVVARVTLGEGGDLAEALLAAGLARPYRARRPDWCGSAGGTPVQRG